MRPVVTPTEMAAIDADAPEPVDELIGRAGWATARAAIGLLGSAYGKRVAVLAGPGNNGADGRRAVPHLERAGAHCTVFDVPGPGTGPDRDRSRSGPRHRPEPFDLVIDACFGTGLRRPFVSADLPIEVGDTTVLAVDIPSGVDGATGELRGTPLAATATITFAAPKPGLLFLPGRRLVGRLTVADIGLDCSRATVDLLEPADLGRWPRRADDDHKWRRAVAIIGGGPGMTGAPRLAALAALRAGAGYAVLSIPGTASARGAAASDSAAGPPIEAVGRPVPEDGWAAELLGRPDGMDRFGAAVVGPGLADTAANRAEVARWWAEAEVPSVLDAGALACLAAVLSGDAGEATDRPRPRVRHVLTPHDGEYARLAGHRPGPDRIAAARDLAAAVEAVVLLKGPTTVVADPDGRVLVSTAGDARLATAGTGDVLSGIVGAGLAGGLSPWEAAGLAAELHGRAALAGPSVGLVASDLPELVAALLSGLGGGGGATVG
jgi:NAD(P)H-hydrate epimerase